MSTQTTFDLHGLIAAIESSDSAYQVALYAEQAEVQIADGDTIGWAPQVLTGRPAIARWIEGMATRQLSHHIIDPHLDRRSLTYVDELQDAEGTTVIHRCTAEISAGQISQETVTVEATMRATDSTFRRRPPAATAMTDEDPDPLPRAWARPTPPTGRYVAGNFFG